MKKCKLNKAWMGHASGTVLEVDEATAKMVIDGGFGVEYVEQPEQKSFDASAIAKAVSDGMREVLAEEKSVKALPVIQTKDLGDEDPCAGFLPGNNKSAEKLDKASVCYAFGKFANDVFRAGQNAGESDLLKKSRERSAKLVQKAAGDGMMVGSDENGGYMIFSAASMMIQASTLENAIVRPMATKVTMGTQLLQLPFLRDSTHATGTVFGGIAIYFDDELAAYTSSRPTLGKLEMKLKKMTALGYVSDEWAKWSPVTMGSWLIPKFGEAIGFKEDTVFLSGKGGAQPLGLINAAAGIAVAKETNQSATSFVLENSTKMFAKLRVAREGSVAWLMNRNVFPQLPLLNVAVGTGGAPVFLSNVGGAPGQSLWGYPIKYTEKVPALGTSKAVVLADLSDYIVADDQTGPEIAQSIHLKFDVGQQAFRITKYVDGQNMTAQTLTPQNGDAISPVIYYTFAA